MPDIFYLNGKLVPAGMCNIPVSDRSYLLGEGLFETVLVERGDAVYLTEHLHRLQQSSAFFAYSLPPAAELTEAVYLVISANGLTEGSIRLTVSPGKSNGLLATPGSPLNMLITFRRGRPYPAHLYREGIAAIVARTTRRNEHSPLSRHKTTNFLDNILAKREAVSLGVEEAIIQNTAGNLAEGTVTNLFLVIGGEVVTPPVADGALPGIIRDKVLQLCNMHKIPACENTLKLSDLAGADEAFLTNSLMGIMPLARIGGYSYKTLMPESLTIKLMKLFFTYLRHTKRIF